MLVSQTVGTFASTGAPWSPDSGFSGRLRFSR